MTIIDEGQRLRMEIVRLGSDHRARRYPRELRRRILGWVERAIQTGLRERQCADQLGLSTRRLAVWRKQIEAGDTKALVRVAVRDESTADVTVAFVTPTGHRIEGLTLEQAKALLLEFS